MVRIEIDGGGAVCIRQEGQRSLPNCMTVCECETEEEARRLVMLHCAEAWDEDTVREFLPPGNEQIVRDSQRGPEYTGYMVEMPRGLRPDDALAYVRRKFSTPPRIFQGKK